tara:strand:+ start:1118 stop:2599 length:1482 start_codon:yes stop_codon:yes gene_type:complete
MAARIHFESGHTAIPSNNITGNGTINQVAKFTGANAIGDSIITANGTNVGIGTTTPTFKLDVVGDVQATGIIRGERVQVGTAATLNDATGVGNTLQFANYNPAVFVTGSADSYIYKNSNVFGGLPAQALIFQTRSDTTGGGFSFVAGGTPAPIVTMLGTGNVGIGTATPSKLLEVASNSNPTIRIKNSLDGIGNATIGTLEFFSADTSTPGGARVISAVECLNDAGSSVPNGNLIFSTALGGALGAAATERMRITSTGNVGIGTTSPNAKLSIAVDDITASAVRAIKLGGGTSIAGNGNYIQFSSSSNDTLGSQIVGTRVSGASSDLRFLTTTTGNTVTEKLRILDNGGITFNGDTAAANALDDYEEGTCTMGVSFGGASVGVVYFTNIGTYTKIGRQVTVNGYIRLTNKGSSLGAAKITGLPFTIASGVSNYSAPSFYFDNIIFTNQFQGYSEVGTTNLVLTETTTLGVTTPITNADFANNSEVILLLTYFV